MVELSLMERRKKRTGAHPDDVVMQVSQTRLDGALWDHLPVDIYMVLRATKQLDLTLFFFFFLFLVVVFTCFFFSVIETRVSVNGVQAGRVRRHCLLVYFDLRQSRTSCSCESSSQ